MAKNFGFIIPSKPLLTAYDVTWSFSFQSEGDDHALVTFINKGLSATPSEGENLGYYWMDYQTLGDELGNTVTTESLDPITLDGYAAQQMTNGVMAIVFRGDKTLSVIGRDGLVAETVDTSQFTFDPKTKIETIRIRHNMFGDVEVSYINEHNIHVQLTKINIGAIDPIEACVGFSFVSPLSGGQPSTLSIGDILVDGSNKQLTYEVV